MSWYATKKASKLPYMNKNEILVFDLETTGLEAAVDEILQITILDGYGSELFSSYIKPTRHRIWPGDIMLDLTSNLLKRPELLYLGSVLM